MKIAAIVQARTGSTRLPGKVLMKLNDKPMLQWVIERLKLSKKISQICVATTTESRDDQVCNIAKKLGAACFRGSENDVLLRFRETADALRLHENDLVVRITADCPLIDPEITDEVISFHEKNKCEYTNNVVDTAHFPRGFDTEILSYGMLKKIDKIANSAYDREHVTTYIRNNPEKFKVGFYQAKRQLRRPDIRVCVDTKEDFERVKKIAAYLGEKNISAKTIVGLFKKPRMAIIGEAGQRIGMGHIIRPLKIADYLRDMIDAEISVFINDESLIKKIKTAGYVPVLYKTPKTRGERIEIIRGVLKQGFDSVVVDLYGISGEDVNGKAFCLEESYRTPDLAILPMSFDKAKRNEPQKEVKKLLISFGGSDPYNLTLNTIVSLQNSKFNMYVVFGAMSRNFKDTKKFAINYRNIKIFHDTKNMLPLMSRTDLAICNGGTTMYELVYLGIPCIVVCATPDETKGAKQLENKGAIVNLGYHAEVKPENIRKAVYDLAENFEKRKSMSQAGINTVKNYAPVLAKRIVSSLIPQ